MSGYKCQRRVEYHETDQMGVVHHANYLHWFEVARTEYFRDKGCSYKELEEVGVLLPVLEVNCNYHRPAKYDDLVTIIVKIKELKQVKISFEYQVKLEDELLMTGTTTHPFVNQDFKPIPLRKKHSELWDKIFGDE
ncbi:thioesterase family protein [Halanaerocella petrolearia]